MSINPNIFSLDLVSKLKKTEKIIFVHINYIEETRL